MPQISAGLWIWVQDVEKHEESGDRAILRFLSSSVVRPLAESPHHKKTWNLLRLHLVYHLAMIEKPGRR
jgi:hypothetical protein